MNRIENLSLTRTALGEHADPRAVGVVRLNYVSPDHRLPLPTPKGDFYLGNTSAAALQDGEVAICTTLIAGLKEYYRRLKLIPDTARIIEASPMTKGPPRYGFPATDALELLRGQNIMSGEKIPYLVPTFTNNKVREQARSLGMVMIDRPDSVLTNNKARLREASSQYGFRVLPGMILDRFSSVTEAVNRLGESPFGVWLKFPTGSGGDLVLHIESPVTGEKILSGIAKLRALVGQAFTEADFETTLEDFWPNGSLCPDGLPISLELDARNIGEIVVNGSTQFITNTNDHSIIGHFEQITTKEGEYLGNEPYYPTDSIRSEIEKQVARVAEYNMSEHGFRGIQGVDWFLINQSGRNVIYIDELNSRPTANTPPFIIAQKLGAPHWINTNVYTDKPIYTIDDYISLIGRDLAYGELMKEGLVIPQAFRTLVTDSQVFASPDFKILILGRDRKQCHDIMEQLSKRGIRFHP